MTARFSRLGVVGWSALAVAAVAATTQAPAQNGRVTVYGKGEGVNVERVPYGDLTLSISADRKTLFGRVGRAVRTVCEFGSTGITSDYRTCSAHAWGGARPQIDAAMVKSSLALNDRRKGGAFILVRR